MRKYLPSKQFSIILGSSIAVFLVFFFIFQNIESSQTASSESLDLVSVTTLSEVAERDTDNDGLYDWEEVLWNMDPANPDTNGDGVLDGQTVEQRRQDLKKTHLINENNQPQTQTDALAQQMLLFATSNPNPSPEEMQSFVNSIIDVATISEPIAYYNIDDIETADISLSVYRQNISPILAQLQTGNKPADIPIIAILLTENANPGTPAFDNIVNLASIYQNTAEDLSRVPVPSQLASTHVAIMNHLINIAGSLQSLALNYQNDPTLAISALSLYDKSVDNFISTTTYLFSFL